MTNEYVRAVREHGLRYPDLRLSVRASLEYSFLPGGSLWADGRIGTPVTQCAASLIGRSCQGYLAGNEKALAQANLERQLDDFETGIATAQ